MCILRKPSSEGSISTDMVAVGLLRATMRQVTRFGYLVVLGCFGGRVFVAAGCGGADVTAAGFDGGMGVTCSYSVGFAVDEWQVQSVSLGSLWAAERRVSAYVRCFARAWI